MHSHRTLLLAISTCPSLYHGMNSPIADGHLKVFSNAGLPTPISAQAPTLPLETACQCSVVEFKILSGNSYIQNKKTEYTSHSLPVVSGKLVATFHEATESRTLSMCTRPFLMGYKGFANWLGFHKFCSALLPT